MSKKMNAAKTENKFNPFVVLFLVLFGSFILVRLFAGGAFFPTPDIEVSRGSEMKIPDLETLDGEARSIADWSGKVLVVNFWATWCPPCVSEMPSLVSLGEKTRGKNVEVIFVSREEPSEIRPFIEKREYPEAMYFRSPGDARKWTSEGIPATYILDSEGRILDSHVGGAKWDGDEVVAQLVELAPKAPQNDETPDEASPRSPSPG
ncbi:MAG: TlpA family protein disulfide reductase [Candidatus Omnitrophica bacterium]|nr:TlpA family protein disulfide reductase [Candidatus Omnitrophota bacterium]MCB9785016.1 TlpA family protein disulfide reductase [Candidatus Omnitrophota bacterium]